MRKTRSVGLALLLGAMLGFAAFPSGADSLPVLHITIQNARFKPTVLQVPAGKKFKLTVLNKGPAVEEFESSDLNREEIVLPGRSIEVYLGPLQPGRYKVFGDFHPKTAKAELIAK